MKINWLVKKSCRNGSVVFKERRTFAGFKWQYINSSNFITISGKSCLLNDDLSGEWVQPETPWVERGRTSIIILSFSFKNKTPEKEEDERRRHPSDLSRD